MGGVRGAGLSVFFFTMNPDRNIFFGGGGQGREGAGGLE